jgi:hypothetical protein
LELIEVEELQANERLFKLRLINVERRTNMENRKRNFID